MVSGLGTDEFAGTLTDYLVMVSFLAVSFYNVAEINLLIFNTFRRYQGIYFWSMLWAVWGIFFHNFGLSSKFLGIINPDWICVTISSIGWYGMITGQSLVLWSRLHIVVVNKPKLIRRVLWTIIIDAFVFHIPTSVLTFGSNSPKQRYFLRGYDVFEKIQMTAFFIQECIISGIYLYHIYQLTKAVNTKESTRRILHHAIWVNVIVIALDIVLLGTEFASLYYIETVLKGMVYSIKLKGEFLILNRLRAHLLQNDRSVVFTEDNGISLQNQPTYPGGTQTGTLPMRINVQHETCMTMDQKDHQKSIRFPEDDALNGRHSLHFDKYDVEKAIDIKQPTQ